MDLLSVAAPVVEVTIAPNVSVPVQGLSLRSIASLLARFPNLLSVFNGREFDIAALLAVAPEAAAAIMAAGAGHLADAKAEDTCAGLALEYQVDLLAKILELTFPGGIGPFVDRLTQLTSSLPAPTGANGAGPGHATPSTN